MRGGVFVVLVALLITSYYPHYVNSMNAMRMMKNAMTLSASSSSSVGARVSKGPIDNKKPVDCNSIMQGQTSFATSAKQTITREKAVELCNKLPKTTADRVYYHWTTWSNCIRWSVYGMDAGEMAYLANQHTSQAAGGGFYMAGTSSTTRNYGPCVVNVLIKKDTPRWDANVAKTVLGLTFTVITKSEVGQRIPFIDYYNSGNDWWVVHHLDPIARLSVNPAPPGVSPAGDGTKGDWAQARTYLNYPTPDFYTLFKILYPATKDASGKFVWDSIVNEVDLDKPESAQAALLRDSLGYLRSFYFLMLYFDGSSLWRAAKVAPKDPWSQFDPQGFGPFMKTHERYILRFLKNEPLGLTSSGRFGDGKSNALTWAQNVRDKILPQLFKDISGQDIRYRGSFVRAGGDEGGQDENGKPFERSFDCTSTQVAEMQANPFLETYAVRTKDNQYFCHYYYPDAVHFEKLIAHNTTRSSATSVSYGVNNVKPKLLEPPGCAGDACQVLIKRLRSKTPAEWMSDANKAEFESATVEVVKQTLLANFIAIHGRPVDYHVVDGGLKAILDLVSVHPCADFNGRTTRFFGRVAQMESLKPFPFAFMSDLDLVTFRSQYGTFLQKSTELYNSLMMKMFNKMLQVTFGENRKAEADDYYSMPEFESVWQSLDVIIGAGKGKVPPGAGTDKDFLYRIQKRRWIPLLNQLAGGPSWGNSLDKTVRLDIR